MKTTRKIACSSLLCFVILAATAFKQSEWLTQQQAVRLAEAFIKDNGYTSAPGDTSKMSFEMLDRLAKNRTDIIKRRHNKLHPQAFFISEDEDYWHIGFLSSRTDIKRIDQQQTDLLGRAVMVEKRGLEVRIAHKTAAFAQFKKLKR